MDLKQLLNKTAKKNNTFEIPNIKPFSIAKDDRPYAELLPVNNLEDNPVVEPKKIKEHLEKTSSSEKTIELENISAPKELISHRLEVKKNDKIKLAKKQSREGEGDKKKLSVTLELPSIEDISWLDTSKSKNEKSLFKDPKVAFLLLSGGQKKIVDYFFELSIKNNTSKIGPITRDTILMALDLPLETFKKSILRLKEKGIVFSSLSRGGKGGWTIYEFNSAFYQELLSSARLKSGFKTELPSVISTPELMPQNRIGDIPAIWAGLEYESLEEYGFTKNHLIQVYKDQEKSSATLDLDSMQYSLDAFKFDMENNHQILKERIRNKSPIMFLTQILGKGRPYGSFTPEKFKTPEQVAILKYKEKQEQINKELQSLKDTYFETEFQNWYENLTDKDAEELQDYLGIKLDGIPEKLRLTYKMRAFKEHFTQFVWLDVIKRLKGERNK